MITTFKTGILLSLSIIISIGAQNLFVIKQGLRGEYPYLSALCCFLCDMFLILLGVTGISGIIYEFPKLKIVILMLGILFLLGYGAAAIKRGFNIGAIHQSLQQIQEQQNSRPSLAKLIILALSFSLLNPQAILDTLVIIGGSANHYTEVSKYFFVAGTIAASLFWFFGLAIATSYFAKRLMNAKVWCGLEMVSGAVMLFIAGKFLLQVI